MLYRFLADSMVVLHFLFVIFVFFGGFLALRWRKMAWAHLPCVAWAVGIEFLGGICPLTYLENYFRRLGAETGYTTSFTEEYLLPLLYPETLFPGGFPRIGFIWIGVFIFTLNAMIYWRYWKRLHDSGSGS